MTNEQAISIMKIQRPRTGTKEKLEAYDMAIEALEQEPCEDAISRESLRQKLQEHHDFFVNAYGGFSNLSQNDKARVDEISSCIAMVVNEPSVTPQPKVGKWINVWDKNDYDISTQGRCNRCKQVSDRPLGNFCKWCGAKMEVEE